MSYYKVQKENPVSAGTMEKVYYKYKYFILHKGDSVWHLSIQKIDPNEISGNLSALPSNRWKFTTTNPNGGTRYKNTRGNNESYVLDEVHLYLDGGAKFQGLKSGSNVAIPFSELIRAEIYTKDTVRTQESSLIGGIGITVVSAVIIGLVIVLSVGF